MALVGRWESVSKSRSDIGAVLEFRRGGQLLAIPTVMHDGTYRTEGDRLIRRMPNEANDLVLQFTVRGDTLTLVAAHSVWRRQRDQSGPDTLHLYRRPASTSRRGLVGQWSYPDYSGAPVFEDYTEQGMWRFRLPFGADTLRYTVRADTVVMQAAAGAGRYRWSISGGRLRIEPLDEAGPAELYNRAPSS